MVSMDVSAAGFHVLTTFWQARETFVPLRFCRRRPLLVVWVSLELARSRLRLR